MYLLKHLTPAFLRELDQRIERRVPWLWATRIHLHLWFLLLCHLALCGMALLLPVELGAIPDPWELFVESGLVALAYLVCWTFLVVRKRSIGERVARSELMVHLASVLLVCSLPFTPALTLTWRIDRLVDDAQLEADLALMDAQAHWFLCTNGAVEGFHNYWHEGDYREFICPVTHGRFADLDAYQVRVRSGLAYRPPPEEEAAEGALYFIGHGLFSGARPWGPELEHLEAGYLAWLQAGAKPDTAAIRKAMAVAARYAPEVVQLSVAQVIAERAAERGTSSNLYAAREPMERIRRAKERDHAFLDALPGSGRRTADKEPYWSVVLRFAFAFALAVVIFRRMGPVERWWALGVGVLLPVAVVVLIYVSVDITNMRGDLWAGHLAWWTAVLLVVALVVASRARRPRRMLSALAALGSLVLPFMAYYGVLLASKQWDLFGLEELNGYCSHCCSLETMIKVAELRSLAEAMQMRALTWALLGGLTAYTVLLHPWAMRVHQRMART